MQYLNALIELIGCFLFIHRYNYKLDVGKKKKKKERKKEG